MTQYDVSVEMSYSREASFKNKSIPVSAEPSKQLEIVYLRSGRYLPDVAHANIFRYK